MRTIAATFEGGIHLNKRWMLPIGMVLFLIVGLASPLFNLHHLHGFPGVKAYGQHLYWDSIADIGGWWAAGFCNHWYHRVPLAIFFALASTFALVTLVG